MQTKTISVQPQQSTSNVPHTPHNLIVEDRHTMTATGVTRVISCDESGAVLETQQGMLTVGGQGLQVSELSIQSGELKVYGRIDFLQYSAQKEGAGGFLKRLVR